MLFAPLTSRTIEAYCNTMVPRVEHLVSKDRDDEFSGSRSDDPDDPPIM